MRKGTSIKYKNSEYLHDFGPTFMEFVKDVVSTSEDDPHWRTTMSECALCTVNYDIILK